MADGEAEKVVSAQKLKKLCKSKLQTKNQMAELSGELGEQISNAVQRDNLNKRAFSIASGLYIALSKDAVKGGRLLRDLKLYMDQLELEAMAATELPLEEPEVVVPVGVVTTTSLEMIAPAEPEEEQKPAPKAKAKKAAKPGKVKKPKPELAEGLVAMEPPEQDADDSISRAAAASDRALNELRAKFGPPAGGTH